MNDRELINSLIYSMPTEFLNLLRMEVDALTIEQSIFISFLKVKLLRDFLYFDFYDKMTDYSLVHGVRHGGGGRGAMAPQFLEKIN